ncbi:ATP-binding protein [Plantactinospora sp. B5E13]|uniref:ATP-binding protein n=1 Tax=unclassified Plantactinospora TaxID=2631981 RepID=UPI00325D4473
MSDGPLEDQRTDTQPGSVLLQIHFVADQITAARQQVTRCLQAHGLLEGDRLDDFVTAINEAMTNAVRHGGGRGELRLWRDRQLVCEVTDRGSGLPAALPIPHARPQPSANGGMGLWLARQLADSMEVDSGLDGVRVRLAMALPADPAHPERAGSAQERATGR